MSEKKLKGLQAVQGFGWPDTDILVSNGFSVRVANYFTAFRLLEHQFVDYFPRSVAEIEQEQENHPSLVIAPHIGLYYPSLMYFFVRPDNQMLAKRLNEGLLELEKQGELQVLFNQQSFVQSFNTLLKGRSIYNLKADISKRSEQVLHAIHPIIK